MTLLKKKYYVLFSTPPGFVRYKKSVFDEVTRDFEMYLSFLVQLAVGIIINTCMCVFLGRIKTESPATRRVLCPGVSGIGFLLVSDNSLFTFGGYRCLKCTQRSGH